ncbi:MAG: hypothetical protein AAF799_32960 [Myxococcota bacterium]
MKLAALALALVYAAVPSPSFASAVTAPAQSEARVSVTWVGPREGIDAAERATAERVERIGAELAQGRTETLTLADLFAPPGAARAVAYVDLREEGIARVYVIDPERERIFMRTLHGGERLDAVVVDELAHVLGSSFEVLLTGGELGVSRAEAQRALEEALGSENKEDPPEAKEPTEETATPPPTSPPAEEPVAPVRPRPWVGADGGYRFRALASRAWLHGPTVAIRGGIVRGRVSLGGSLEGTYYVPSPEVANDELGLRLTGGDVSLAFRAAFQVAPVVLVGVEAGPVLSLLSDRTRVLNDRAEAFAPQLRVASSGRLALGLDIVLGGPARLVLGLHGTLDAEIAGHVYQTADTSTVVLDPWPVQPGAALRVGGAFDLPRGR